MPVFMDLNQLLIWTIGFWCILLLVWLFRLPFSYLRGWVGVTVLIITVTAGMLYVYPSIAGLVGGSLWLLFVVLPMIGMRKVTQLIYARRYGEARKLSAKVRWLHPVDGWVEQPEILRALEMGQRGEMAAAFQILKPYQNTVNPIGRSATVLLYQMDSRWSELLLWIRDRVPEKVLANDSTLVSYYLRSLGETGDLNGLVQEFDRFERTLEKIGGVLTLNQSRMVLLAFCGQIEKLQQLFKGSLKVLPLSIRKFWLATAEIAVGNEDFGRQQLIALRDTHDRDFGNAIAWRLSHPVPSPDRVLSASSQQILLRISNDLIDESKYSPAVNLSGKKPLATYAIIAINLLAFILEIKTGGSQNLENLYRLGALYPQDVWAGEWWRLLSANFLHAGFLHLAMNMMGLYVIGSFVEFSLGSWRYLISYFASGVGSMFIICILSRFFNSQSVITVGASGAIMGLVGVMGAIMLWGWRREKSRIAARGLRSIILIIVLQLMFDLSNPQVSIAAHNYGLILGFITGNLLILTKRSKN